MSTWGQTWPALIHTNNVYFLFFIFHRSRARIVSLKAKYLFIFILFFMYTTKFFFWLPHAGGCLSPKACSAYPSTGSVRNTLLATCSAIVAMLCLW